MGHGAVCEEKFSDNLQSNIIGPVNVTTTSTASKSNIDDTLTDALPEGCTIVLNENFKSPIKIYNQTFPLHEFDKVDADPARAGGADWCRYLINRKNLKGAFD